MQSLLPVKGTYRIVFYGGKLHKPLTAICQLSFICKEAYTDPVPLAVDPGCVGLGPGPFAIMCGLISPTYTNGVIQLEMNKTLKLKFRVGYKLLECFKIKGNLYNSNGIVLKGDTTSMADFSISNTIQGKEVTITVTTPDYPGYYMLELLTNKDETKWTSACFYLLVYKALTQVFIERCSQKVRKKILMKVTETGDAHQIMFKIQDCTNKHFPENDLDIQKARGKVALLKTPKKKSQIYSTIFPKESFDSSNIVRQSQYEKSFYDMHKNLRSLTKHLRNMYCSSSQSSQPLDTRSLFPEEKHVIRMMLILFGKPVDEEKIFVKLLDDIVKELGQTGLELKIENVRKTAAIAIRFTSEQIKYISKAAARVYITVQDIVDWMLKSS